MGNFLTAYLHPFLRLATCLGICRGVWGLFRLLEREKSLLRRPSLRQIVDIVKAPASIFSVIATLPAGVLSAFDAIFTDNLWSWRGFRRSLKVSAWTVGLLLILWYTTIPAYVHLEIGVPHRVIGGPPLPVPYQGGSPLNYALTSRIFSFNSNGGLIGVFSSIDFLIPIILAPFIYNFFADYFALIVTRRVVLEIISKTTNNYLILSVFILSIFCILVIADVGFTLYVTMIELVGGYYLTISQFIDPEGFIRRIAFPLYHNNSTILGQPWTVHTIIGVFLCSTLIGIFWVFIFSVAAIIANATVKIRRLGPWLNSKINIQKQPFVVIGGIMVIFMAVVCVMLNIIIIVV